MPERAPVEDDLPQALADALALLRALPRRRGEWRQAEALVARFKVAHPRLPCRLLSEEKPGSDALDHDLLLTIGEAGTLALSWHGDDGVPWVARYADHWAANYVLTVDGRSTTIQSALLYLGAQLRRRPDLMQELVDRALVAAAIAEAPPDISEAELEAAVDAFRESQGLYSGAETQRWLDEMQLTMEALGGLVAQSLQITKFKERLTGPAVTPHFAAHRRDFDRVSLLRLDGLSEPGATHLAEAWRKTGRCPVLEGAAALIDMPNGRIETVFARDLPAELAGADTDAVIGPMPWGGRFRVAQVIRRHAAQLDDATRARIGELLFGAWLAERRTRAAITWHWV
jgi:putative peptide maturation system protein